MLTWVICILYFFIPGGHLEERNSSSNGMSCECGWKNPSKLRIAGGVEVEDYEYPFMAGLMPLDSEETDCYEISCGAVIISDFHLVTAAHCIHPNKFYAVVAAISQLETCFDDGTQIRKVTATIHPYYDPAKLVNDIAVLTADTAFSFQYKNVGPVCLPSDERVYNWPGTNLVLGYGITEEEPEGSDVLLEVDVPSLDFDECLSTYQNRSISPISRPSQFCTEQNGVGPCMGDSGGPVLMRTTDGHFILRGLVSFGPRDCMVRFPSVHTSIQPYLKWIQNTTNEPLCVDL